MPKAGWKELVLLALCVSIPCSFSYFARLATSGQIQMFDFGAVYYGARCAMHHLDPYAAGPTLEEFEADGGSFAPSKADKSMGEVVITRNDNLPTALFLTIPLALLPWGIAQNIWMILTAALLVAAAFLTWDLGAGMTPLLWAGLAGFMLAECDLLIDRGNVAGVAVSLCVIAAWCFLKNRFVWAGAVLLALSLLLKPHDSGFVWLYFLLAGGTLRKRALQTLAVTAVLAACAALWITPISPHWLQELHSNLATASARGGTSDPGPTGVSSPGIAESIDLQAVLSFFKDDPHFYNPVSYLICGILILVWGLKTWHKRFSMESARLALAAIAALSLLPVYHRPYDAALLLLALPACATLWNAPGPRRWFALVLTTGGILLTGTIPLVLLDRHSQALAALASGLPGRLPTVLLLRPTPFVLFAMGCFYLWVYLRYESERVEESADVESGALRQQVSEPAS